MYFQKKAWADSAFSARWLRRTFIPAAVREGEGEVLLTADNLTGQTEVEGEFKKLAAQNSTLVWNLPPGYFESSLFPSLLLVLSSFASCSHSRWQSGLHDLQRHATVMACLLHCRCTDEIQPTDAGVGQEVKRQVGLFQMEWLVGSGLGFQNKKYCFICKYSVFCSALYVIILCSVFRNTFHPGAGA